QIGNALFADPILLQLDLLIGFIVHEDEGFAVVEQVGVVALFQRDALDLVFRAEAFVQLVAGLEDFGLDVADGAALAGLDVAGLGDDPQAAIVLQDHAGLDGVGVDFHGNRRARCWGRLAPTARAWRAKSPGALEDKAKKGNGDGCASASGIRPRHPGCAPPGWPGGRPDRSAPPACRRRDPACALHGRRRRPDPPRTWPPGSGSSVRSGAPPARRR